MSPFQTALLAIEVAVDALHESGTESARDALDQIAHLGFDTRTTEERQKKPEVRRVRRAVQKGLFQI